MSNHPLVVIPARLASVRFPNKPLANILGEPMIVRVWRRALAADVGPVIVASADDEITRTIIKAGGTAIATDPALPSGSDRVFAAALKFDPARCYGTVINLQGDMPMFNPAYLHTVQAPLADPAVDIATLVAPLDIIESANRGVAKVVLGLPGEASIGRALYFSRATIPWGAASFWRHIGIYAYRRRTLARFASLPPSPLEKCEQLEQLRALEAGMRIDVTLVERAPVEVNVPTDIAELLRDNT